MRHGQPMGITPDGDFLLVSIDGDEIIAIPNDERLEAAIRRDRPRLGQLEIEMDSALTPREIQSRIRSGEALAEVAKAAGVPVEQIEPFALPVIAERNHVTGIAQAAQVRRGNEAIGGRGLRTVVNERLLERGVDLDTIEWDSWRVMDRKWIVQATYQSGSAEHNAQFLYDQRGRFSVAHNDDARWLVQEQTPSHGLQPNRRRRSDDPDHEPTIDYADEFAIVRAVGAEPSVEDQLFVDDVALSEVDGVLDIVSPSTGELNNLYDMFTALQEDSVQIYPGLSDIRPVEAQPPAPAPQQVQPAEPPEQQPSGRPLSRRERRRLQAEQNARHTPMTAVPPPEPVRPEPVQLSLTSALDEFEQEESRWRHVTREIPQIPLATEADSEPKESFSEPVEESLAEPTTLSEPVEEPHVEPPTTHSEPVEESLSEPPTTHSEPPTTHSEPVEEPHVEDEPTVTIPKATTKRKRASVPSWDEIMFGAPRPKK